MNSSKGRRARIAVVAACAALTSLAIAGNRYSQPSVSIVLPGDGTGTVTGTLGGVRNSANGVERLSCTVVRNEATNAAGAVTRTTSVSCTARDATGKVATCVSSQEKHAISLDGVNNDSLIEFHFDATGTCTTLWVYESASLERKRT